MDESTAAMATWLGALARGGVIDEPHERAGVGVAAYVVGADRVDELRRWFRDQPAEIVRREKRAAIEACIWMAHADRELTIEESILLRSIVDQAGLEPAEARALASMIERGPALESIADRVTHPVLRELLLALGWEIAAIDGRIDPRELRLHERLADRLGIDADRAEALRVAVFGSVGAEVGAL
ncbi:MAG: TerB family tellurite resistance protein [Myxococcales bacterium]|nr:TerB family tellurite resistance protein [Myxococcales bacterium]